MKVFVKPGIQPYLYVLFAVLCAKTCPAQDLSQIPHAQQPAVAAPSLPQRIGILSEQSLTLDEVIQQVLENNPAVAIRKIEVERARFAVDAARGALDPVAGSLASFQHQVTPVTSFLEGSTTGSLTQNTLNLSPQLSGLFALTGATYQAQASGQRVSSTNQFLNLNPEFPTALTFSVTQPLLRNRKIDRTRYQIEVAKKNVNLSAAQFRQQLLTIVSQAEQAYWQLVFALRNLDVQRQGLELARQQIGSNERRADAGVLAPISVVEAQTQVDVSEQGVYQAQQQVSAAETQLKTLMLPSPTAALWKVGFKAATDFDSAAPAASVDQAIADALANRPEVEQSQISQSLNESDVRFYSNQTKPQVDLVGSYTSSGLSGRAATETPIVIPGFGSLATAPPAALVGGPGQSVLNLLRQDFPTAQVGVQFSFPVGNHTAQANLASAMAQGREIRLQRDQIEQAIAADVWNALQNIASAQARVKVATDGQKSAEDLYASEQRKFEAGTTTVFLLFQRQTAMINARTELARAQADLSIAISQYAAATGGTLSKRNINVVP